MRETENMAYRAYFDETRKFGVELEGYGFSRRDIILALESNQILTYPSHQYERSMGKNEWAVGSDGTIDQANPIEIISPPLAGGGGLAQLEHVCRVLTETGIQSNASCGLHVHWDVSDYTGHAAINLLRLYGKYEPVLDCLFDKSRRGDTNSQCRSLRKKDGLKWTYKLARPYFYRAYQVAMEFEKTQRLASVRGGGFPSARHHKINLCSINKYGTIEFRQHHASFNFPEIRAWIIFSQQLLQRAKDSIVSEGDATWESLIRTLALTNRQLDESVDRPYKDWLRQTRDFYRERYTERYREIHDEILCGV